LTHGPPNVGLALRLVHQEFQARQRPGRTQAFDLEFKVVGFGVNFTGKSYRRQSDQPQAGARLFLDAGVKKALHEVPRSFRALIHLAAHQQWPAYGLANDLRAVGQARSAQHVLEQ